MHNNRFRGTPNIPSSSSTYSNPTANDIQKQIDFNENQFNSFKERNAIPRYRELKKDTSMIPLIITVGIIIVALIVAIVLSFR